MQSCYLFLLWSWLGHKLQQSSYEKSTIPLDPPPHPHITPSSFCTHWIFLQVVVSQTYDISVTFIQGPVPCDLNCAVPETLLISGDLTVPCGYLHISYSRVKWHFDYQIHSNTCHRDWEVAIHSKITVKDIRIYLQEHHICQNMAWRSPLANLWRTLRPLNKC
jgi:hypothetical protein